MPASRQGLLIAKHTSQTTNAQDGPKLFCFNDALVAETIQLSHDGRRVTQRADKRWGTAVSSTPLTDSERIHRWKINVDKCEEGHAFFGVVTRDASCSSYLGEDQHGW